MGEHEISTKERDLVNQRTVCNHAKDISDTASGYFIGNPITYTCSDEDKERMERFTDALEIAEAEDVDQDNALLLSIYGCSYEYVYVAEGDTYLKVKNLSPENTFIVYDDTIEHKELFGVFYYVKKDDANNKVSYVVLVATENHLQDYVLYPSDNELNSEKGEPKEHNLGYIPIIEYKNNKFCIGDFEQQISLIDAYNTLASDRVNDKEQFIDAILVIYGTLLGDTKEETDKALKEVKKKKLLELDLEAKAEYLARTFDEAGVEVLRKALKEDIYTFSHVPNLTDENFAGNSSGVAMEYKLLGLEMLTKIKERYYRAGLRKRIQIFCHFLGLKSTNLNAASIKPSFSRALPKNLQELASIIAMLSDDVSARTLLKLLPFVENPDEEVEAVKKEKKEAAERQQKLFTENPNNKPEELEEDE